MSEFNILSVDDSQYMREIITQILNTNKDYRVMQASNGAEAMKVIQENFIHLVITDINMPIMDGATFVQEAKKNYPGLPILVLTTESGDSLKKEVMGYGANGWIVKPFRPIQLVSLVKEVFN
jgi:two-component system chemotaxis response regulator CheY